MNRDMFLFELRKRLNGTLHWVVPELESLFNSRGGTVRGNSLCTGLNSAYGSNYSACIIHGPINDISSEANIPSTYQTLLKRSNGAKLFAVDLFGLLDDDSNQRRCLSLELANTIWISEYKKLPPRSFHFGSRTFSYFENVGYFYNESLQVYCAKKSGEILNRWPSVEEMLRDEWKISKEIEAETRERLSQPRQTS